MRLFKLKNANGNEYDLSCHQSFLQYPEGLGTERESTYQQLGMSYRKLSTSYKQRIPAGQISFDEYNTFSEFSEFIRHEPLILCYKPDDTWYFIDCVLQSLSKGEISESTGRLDCQIQFFATSTWKKEPVTYKCGSIGGDSGKTYPYLYPYSYSDNVIGSIAYLNKSNLEQYGKIIIDGPAEHPGWVLLKDANVVMSGKVNVVLDSNERLVVNANPLHYEIARYTKTNIYIDDVASSSDFTTKRYVVLPPGESTLNFTSEDAEEITAYLEVSERYELI